MKITETFKDIPNYEGYYQISNLGRVKSLERTIVTKAGVSRKIPEKILKNTYNKGGYAQVSLKKYGIQEKAYVHKMVAETFNGHIADGFKIVIDHKNNNKKDNRANNLETVTQRANQSRKGGTSKYVGVTYMKKINKWNSYITIEGKRYHLGLFADEIDAANRYQEVLNDIKGFLETRTNLKVA